MPSNSDIKTHKTYLGDSVYAELDRGMIRLYTDNGLGPNTPPEGVYLEVEVIEALDRFVARLKMMAVENG